MRIALLLFALIRSACANAGDASILVEPGSPAISKGGLIQAIGIGTIGGVLTVILPKGCAIPCSRAETFGTAEDGQTQITIHLFRGDPPSTSAAHLLGTFRITGFPSKLRGQVIVHVTFIADVSGFRLTARDSQGASDLVLSRVAP
jgi:molecular chaperone DnaK